MEKQHSDDGDSREEPGKEEKRRALANEITRPDYFWEVAKRVENAIQEDNVSNCPKDLCRIVTGEIQLERKNQINGENNQTARLSQTVGHLGPAPPDSEQNRGDGGQR